MFSGFLCHSWGVQPKTARGLQQEFFFLVTDAKKKEKSHSLYLIFVTKHDKKVGIS